MPAAHRSAEARSPGHFRGRLGGLLGVVVPDDVAVAGAVGVAAGVLHRFGFGVDDQAVLVVPEADRSPLVLLDQAPGDVLGFGGDGAAELLGDPGVGQRSGGEPAAAKVEPIQSLRSSMWTVASQSLVPALWA